MEREDTFASRLRDAFADSGLTLTRVSEKLAARGIACSTSTLSLWRSGRTSPKRLTSMTAVRAREDILGCRRGVLEAMVEAHTPGSSGWWNNADDLDKLVRHGDQLGSAVEELSGDFKDTLQRHFLHDTLVLDEHRRLERVASIEVLQARTDGTRHHLIITSDDERLEDGSFNLRRLDMNLGGHVVEQRFLPDIGCIVHKIEFERPLEAGSSHLIDYTVTPHRAHEDDAPTLQSYDLRFARPFGEVVIGVQFRPEDLPSNVFGRYEGLTGEALPAPTDHDRLHLVGDTATFSAQAVSPGVVQVDWDWDPMPADLDMSR